MEFCHFSMKLMTLFIVQYYYEPGSGRKFRSLISVQRHLMEEARNNVRTKNLKSENKKRVIKEEDVSSFMLSSFTSVL